MLEINVTGAENIRLNFEQVKSPALRKRLFTVAARELIKAAKQRIAAQTDLEGRAFTPHAKNRRRKMLARLIRRIGSTVTDSDAYVGWSNPFEGMIAAKHQYGFTQSFNKSQFKAQTGTRSDPATRQQAKALLQAGFKYRSKGKGFKTPTLKWIVQNLKIGQAGLILRSLRGSKSEWKTTLPARSFLGITAQDIADIDQLIQNELIKSFVKATA
jgi:phage gpG-like protein